MRGTHPMASYTVTIPPLGSLVRQGAIRLGYAKRHRLRTVPIGGLELKPGTWHRASDRATPKGRPWWPADSRDRAWSVATLCGRWLRIDPADGGLGYVRAVIASVDFPDGTLCTRCAGGWDALRREIAEPVR